MRRREERVLQNDSSKEYDAETKEPTIEAWIRSSYQYSKLLLCAVL
jgi:hypothetical protein